MLFTLELSRVEYEYSSLLKNLYSSTRKDQDSNHPLFLISQGSLCPNLFIRCYIFT
jgi:hypothetical protein